MKSFTRIFLFLIVAVLCMPLSLEGKTRKTKAVTDTIAPLIARHQWRTTGEYPFHEGSAVVRGQLTGFTDSTPASIVFNLEDLVLAKNQVQLLPVGSDGLVEGTISLPHSQFCYVEGLKETLYVGVGDTLRFVFDASRPEGDRLSILGSGTTADVNRHWPTLKRRFYEQKPVARRAEMNNPDALYAFTALYEQTADSLMGLIAHDRLSLPPLTPLAHDILSYGLINEAMTRVLDAQNQYKRQRLAPYDSLRANHLFVRYEAMMLNTPLALCSTQSWVTSNRMLFNQYGAQTMLRYLCPAETDAAVPFPLNATDSLLVTDWQRFHTLPRQYCPAVADYIAASTLRPSYSLADYWRDVAASIRKQTGLGGSFMSQLGLCKQLVDNVLTDKLANSPDLVAGYVGATLPFITHPLLSRRIVDAYRQWVVEHEATAAGQTEVITDSTLLSLIAPYRGRLLFVDFWNMSCGPCRMAMLDHRDIVARIQQAGIPASVLYVCDHLDKGRQRAEQWLRENGIGGEHIFVSDDQWRRLSSALNFNAIPFCVIIRPDGTLLSNGEKASMGVFLDLLREQFPDFQQ